MTLHLYFARRFVVWLAICFIGIFALMALIDLFDQTRRFADRGVNAGGILELVLLNTPRALSEVLPLIILLATVAFFINLARTSELVATRAVGRSALGALAAPVAVSVLLGTIATTTLNPIVAATAVRYQSLAD
ncbi:MAG: LptF/LptG family permease, partial [Roseobacter sp.]|nr:LptF/LptG family permease [Roseobacter sp.]